MEWITNASDDLAGTEESIGLSVGLAAAAGNIGGFWGAALGALLSHKKGGFDSGGLWWKRVLRSIAGLLLFAALYGTINLISPEESSKPLYSIWRFCGFFVISFSAIFLIPILFIRVKLLSR